MALSVFVKISNISNLSDARYCAGMMADMLGFNLQQTSPDYIDPSRFMEITQWVSGVKLVGEYGTSAVDDIRLTYTDYPLDFLETSRFDQLEEICQLGIPVIFRLPLTESPAELATKIEYAAELVHTIILQTSNPVFPDAPARTSGTTPFLLSAPFTKENIQSLPGNWTGIELSGTPEERPGLKDYGLVMDILETLEE
ncbi:MAG: N-(5'-phosphoribosyl)anthranilate isomerase [Cyclobacteriaceae bacterium]|nr:N-(5'-phosphoribosyl)anthranilate isomerase [Cyclobacteriaceae bacterium]